MSIVKFKSKAAGDIVMYKEHADKLFKIIGVEGGERGVIEPQNLLHAHAQLVAAVNMEKLALAEQPPVDESDLSPQELLAIRNHVSLGQRVYPLLKMLEAAQAKGVDVHWGF